MPGRASSLPPSRAENQNRLGYATSAARVDLAIIGATAGASRGHLLVARLTPGKQTRYALFVPRCESRRKGNMAFLLFYVFHLLRKNSSMSTKLIPKIRICKAHTHKKKKHSRCVAPSPPFLLQTYHMRCATRHVAEKAEVCIISLFQSHLHRLSQTHKTNHSPTRRHPRVLRPTNFCLSATHHLSLQ